MTDYLKELEDIRARKQSRLAALLSVTPQAEDLTPLEVEAQTGVPADVAQRTGYKPDPVQIDRLINESPHLSVWLTEKSLQASVGKDSDELSKLGLLEWLMTAPAKAFQSGQAQEAFGRARSAAGPNPTPAQELQLADLRLQMQAGQGTLGRDQWWMKPLTSTPRLLPTMIAAVREGARGGIPGAITAGAGALAMGPAAPVSAPAAIAGGYYLGSRITSGLYSFDQERGFAMDEFTQLRDQDGREMDPNVAWLAANVAGAVSGGLEVVGIELLLKSVPWLRGASSEGARAAIGELLKVPTIRSALVDAAKSYAVLTTQETGIEMAQRAVVIFAREVAKATGGQTFNPDSSPPILADIGSEGVEALAGIAPVTLPGPVIQAGIGVRDAQIAQQRSQFFEAIGEVAKDSRTAKQAPSAFQALVEKITRNGPVETVYAPIESWNTYFQDQGVDPRQVAAEVLGSTEVYDQVVLSGGDLPIPTARYAAKLAGTVHNGELARVLRFAPDQMNLAEAEQFLKDAEAAERAVPSEPDSVEAIRQDVIGQLRQTGADQVLAESQAEVIASFYRTLGANMGLDPKALYDRFPMDVRGEIPEVLRRTMSINELDVLIDRVRRGERPTDADVYGPSLTEFLAAKGGLLDEGGELAGMDANQSRTTVKKLVREGGMSLDRAAEAAAEAGYLPDRDINALLDAVGAELRGKPVYSTLNATGDRQAALRLRDQMDALEAELADRGVDLADLTNDQLKAMLLAPQGDVMLDQPGYHGSPHRFRRFDLSKVGTGEGAQAYGWGIYFAENPAVAGNYRNALTNRKSMPINEPPMVRSAWSLVSGTPARAQMSVDELAPYLGNAYPAASSNEIRAAIEKAKSYLEEGALYKVDIPDELIEGKLLDWNAPLSEQPEAVRRAVRSIYPEIFEDAGKVTPGWGDLSVAPDPLTMTGGEIMELITSRMGRESLNPFVGSRAASEALREAGIPGLRYLDGNSRGAGEGTRNFVIWDQDLLDRISDTITLEQRVDVTSTPEFRAWFRDSKVVDAEGRPLVVYHGTGDDFDTFQRGRGSRKDDGWLGIGFYFFNSPRLASDYTQLKAGEQKNVMPVYLRLQNPYRATLKDKERLMLASRKGDDALRDWTNKLKDDGHDGVILEYGEYYPGLVEYVVFDSTQIKSATGNSGTFDPNSPNILYQSGDRDLLVQPADGSARGQISFGAPVAGRRPFNIRLLERANRSTFLHESGHMFLEVLGDIVEGDGATDQQKADYQTLLKWLGVKDRAGIQREQHEQFARGFEAYLMEGKAPSAGLRRVFARFRSWLVAIYRTMAGLNVELTDDVRKVMDRLLATEDEIKAAEAEANVEALLTAENAGMSATEFAAYQALVADASVQARDILMQRLMAELERETQKWWRTERDEVKEEVTREIDAMPGYRALAAIRRNELPDGIARPEGLETLKLDRETLEATYGKATRPRGALRLQAPEVGMLGAATRGTPTDAPAVETPPNTVMNRLRDLKVTRTDGLAPQLAAELFGFRDVEELVMTLVNLRPRKELIEAETDRRMREKFPDVRFDGSLADEARAAVMNEKREEVLRAEIAALRRKQREVAPFVRAAKRDAQERRRAGLSLVQSAVPDVATVKDVARRIIAGKRIRDLRPQDYLATARVQAKLAMKAVAIGNDPVPADPKRGLPGFESGWAWAADMKARELLNFHLYKEALAAQKQVQKTVEYATRLQGEPARKRLGKAGADYLDQVDALLGRFSLKPISAKALARKESLRDWIARQQEQGAQIELPEEVVNEAFQKSYRELTVEEFVGIGDSLKTIETAARLKNKLIDANGRREWQEAKASLLDRVDESKLSGKAPPVSPFERTTSEALLEGAKRLADGLLRPETLLEWLDGGETGPWHDLFYNLFNRAEYEREQLRDKVMRPLLELAQGMSRERRQQLEEAVRIDSLGISLNRKTLISIGLNMGNAGNRERLIKGGMIDRAKRYQITDAVLEEVQRKLTREDWEMIQAMWDTVESLWPLARDLEERLTGVAPPKVEATPITVDGVTYRGGYWPAVYDPFGSRAGEKQAEAADSVEKMLGSTFTRATTRKTHLKARTGAAGPLLLNFEAVLSRHIGDVITDLTHREAVLQAMKILRDPDIKLKLVDAIGEVGYSSLNLMVKNAVHADRGTASVVESSANGLLQWVVSNTVVAALGFRAVTAIGNLILAPIQAAARVSPKFIGIGFGRFYSAPRVWTRFIHARSPMMQQRATNMDATFVDTITRLRGERGIRAQAGRAAMSIHRWADFAATNAIWLGRYEEALVAGESEAVAAELADKSIRMTQTAGAAKDLSAVESIPWLKKTGLTMFLGPMLIMGNRIQDAVLRRGTVQSWPEAFGTMLAVWFLPAVLWDLATGRGPEDDDEDTLKDESLWALRKIILYPFLTVPILRDVAAVLDAKADGKRLSARANPAVQGAMLFAEAGVQAGKAGVALWEGDEVDAGKVGEAAVKAAGPLVGLPSNQLLTTGEFLHDVMTGEYEIQGPADLRYLAVRRLQE